MVQDLLARIEQRPWLDPFVDGMARTLEPLLRKEPIRAVLGGRWLGHRAHPMLTDAVLGTWMSSTLLDIAGGDRSAEASQRLVEAGLVAAVPTALTGTSDWFSEGTSVRRLGVVHAAANWVSILLQLASLGARRRGDHARGRLWSLAAVTVSGAAGYLGGHMSYRLGAGVDLTQGAPERD